MVLEEMLLKKCIMMGLMTRTCISSWDIIML